ncbi:MAG: OadG family protein [Lachnospiraceae bacterium]|nr:OadG family protein [Lachnospiraceae bacterium]
MKKRLIFLACCLAVIFAFCGCESKEAQTYGDYTAEQLEASAQNTANSLMSLGQDEVLQYISYYEAQAEDSEEAALNYSLISDWAEVMNQVGNFNGYSDFVVDKSGKTLTATLTMDFENRDAKLIYVFNANSMDVTAINVELVYSLGEIMSKAALNTVMGILTVFVILVLISFVIFGFRIIPYLEKKFSEKPNTGEVKVEETKVESAVEETDDLELVAVIAAAIASETGTPTDSFVVRSIKRRY